MEEIVNDASGQGEAEKLVPQSRVNELVGRAKSEAAKAASDKIKAEMEQMQMQQMQMQQSAPQSMGGMQQGSQEIEERIYQRILEEAERRQQEAYDAEREANAKQVASNYFNKMQSGKEKFDDFDEVMKDFKPDAFHQVVYLAQGMENTPEIMYELQKNPEKLAQVALLAERDPNQAQKMLARLSDSIMQNAKAKAEHVPTKPPLSRLKSSNVGMDTGAMGLQDLKKQSWLKG